MSYIICEIFNIFIIDNITFFLYSSSVVKCLCKIKAEGQLNEKDFVNIDTSESILVWLL